jgi:hypothetical protein
LQSGSLHFRLAGGSNFVEPFTTFSTRWLERILQSRSLNFGLAGVRKIAGSSPLLLLVEQILKNPHGL